MNRRAAGAGWEAHAERHLHAHGLATVARNFHSRFGEIDLVMRDGAALVFVEVRYRGAGANVRAAASVGTSKRHRLVRAAQFFLLRHPQWRHAVMRFDVVAIDEDSHGRLAQHWYRDAFRAG